MHTRLAVWRVLQEDSAQAVQQASPVVDSSPCGQGRGSGHAAALHLGACAAVAALDGGGALPQHRLQLLLGNRLLPHQGPVLVVPQLQARPGTNEYLGSLRFIALDTCPNSIRLIG